MDKNTCPLFIYRNFKVLIQDLFDYCNESHACWIDPTYWRKRKMSKEKRKISTFIKLNIQTLRQLMFAVTVYSW
jgi:hypothetical protein